MNEDANFKAAVADLKLALGEEVDTQKNTIHTHTTVNPKINYREVQGLCALS